LKVFTKGGYGNLRFPQNKKIIKEIKNTMTTIVANCIKSNLFEGRSVGPFNNTMGDSNAWWRYPLWVRADSAQPIGRPKYLFLKISPSVAPGVGDGKVVDVTFSSSWNDLKTGTRQPDGRYDFFGSSDLVTFDPIAQVLVFQDGTTWFPVFPGASCLGTCPTCTCPGGGTGTTCPTCPSGPCPPPPVPPAPVACKSSPIWIILTIIFLVLFLAAIGFLLKAKPKQSNISYGTSRRPGVAA
jgi:hypothetical protein